MLCFCLTDRNEVSQSLLSSPPSKRDSSSGKRVVSDSEWQKLQIEVIINNIAEIIPIFTI